MIQLMPIDYHVVYSARSARSILGSGTDSGRRTLHVAENTTAAVFTGIFNIFRAELGSGTAQMPGPLPISARSCDGSPEAAWYQAFAVTGPVYLPNWGVGPIVERVERTEYAESGSGTEGGTNTCPSKFCRFCQFYQVIMEVSRCPAWTPVSG